MTRSALFFGLAMVGCTTGGSGGAGAPGGWSLILPPGTTTTPTTSTTSTTTTPTTSTTSTPSTTGTTTTPGTSTTPPPTGAAAVAFAQYFGDGPENWAGFEARRVGDVNGDGFEDLAFGSELSGPNLDDAGVVFVFYGPVSAGDHYLSDADVVFEGAAPGDRLGRDLANAADLTGDGIDDIVATAYRAEATPTGWSDGAVLVFDASSPGVQNAANAHARLWGPAETMSGYNGVAAGDLTGDGAADLAIPTQMLVAGGPMVWLVHGPMSGDIDLVDGPSVYDPDLVQQGEHAPSIRDWTGDGQADLLLALPNEGGLYGAGGGRVYFGPIAGSVWVGAQDVRIEGDPVHDYMSEVIDAGDVDGDGHPDALFAAPYADVVSDDEGQVALVHGPLVADTTVLASGTTIDGQVVNGYVGDAVGAGDFDGDGFSDLVVTESERGVYPRESRVHVFMGPVSGSLTTADADLTWASLGSEHFLGWWSVDNVGDVDGDGLVDLSVGAYGDTGLTPDDLGVYYLIGGSTF